MKMSRRAKRIQRHYRRSKQGASLNLVSLMDIFTILVFFLMVNSSDVKVLTQDKSVKLPESTAEQQPKETLVLTVSGDNLIVQGRVVAQLQDVNEEGLYPGLIEELKYQASKNESFKTLTNGYPITLVADKSTPYKILKKVMATCTAANYTQISLATSKVKKSKEA